MKSFSFSALALCMLLSIVFAQTAASEDHAVTAGYGFGLLNTNKRTAKMEGGKNYDYFRASYLYERPSHYPNVRIVIEPFAAYVNRPNDGLDIGFTVGIKWYPFASGKGFYVSPQAGMAYTTINFEEQGTHLLFILEGALGFRYGNFFVEDRFKHYSNGHTASPNRSVHSNIVVVGMYF
jgi:hypothetical protein